MRRIWRVLTALVSLSLIAAAPIRLESNRTTYKISLGRALPGGIIAVNGRVVIEFRVTCTSYDTTQRFLADMTGPDRTVSRSDFVIRAAESRSGRSMRFDITNMVDGQVAERYKGRASRNLDGTGAVTLSLPSHSEFALPAGTILPTIQTRAVLRAAAAGKRRFNSPIFQGGNRSSLYQSTAAIGARASAARIAGDTRAGGALLEGVPAWPVLMSYYPLTGDSETPEYEIATRLYANGVIGSMSMIYPRFTLKADLVKAEKLSTPKC